MTGWLVVNGFLHGDKFDELTEMFLDSARRRQIDLQVKRNSDCLVDVGGGGGDLPWTGSGLPDFAIFWDKDVLLAEYLESMGIRVSNSSRSIAVCDDKRKTHLALQAAGLPMPETIFAPMSYPNIGFPDRRFLEWVEGRLNYPIVVKEAYGSFGEQVYLAGNRNELEDIMDRCGTAEILFQKYIEKSSGRDIRLQVVGNCVVGAMYRYSERDFRANISAGGQMCRYEPDEEERQLAIRAARAVDADFAGVDLLFGEKGALVCEVNSNAHFKNLMDCTGVNTADAILQFMANAPIR